MAGAPEPHARPQDVLPGEVHHTRDAWGGLVSRAGVGQNATEILNHPLRRQFFTGVAIRGEEGGKNAHARSPEWTPIGALAAGPLGEQRWHVARHHGYE